MRFGRINLAEDFSELTFVEPPPGAVDDAAVHGAIALGVHLDLMVFFNGFLAEINVHCAPPQRDFAVAAGQPCLGLSLDGWCYLIEFYLSQALWVTFAALWVILSCLDLNQPSLL